MRILHLLDPANCGDEGVLACAAAMQAPAGTDPHVAHEAWIIGNGACERRAWALGVPSTDRVVPRPGVLGRDPTAASLGRLRAARYPDADPDVVQCWSLEGLLLARRVFGLGASAPARVTVVCRAPSPGGRAPDTPGTDLATGRETLAVLDPAARAILAGLPPHDGPDDAERRLHAIRLIEPPAFAPGGPVAVDRTALRESLGIDPTDTVIGLLADPAWAGDAQRLAFIAGVSLAAGHRTVSLVRRGAQNERRAAAYVRAHAHRWGLALADLSLPELIAASDLVLADSPTTPSSGPTALALALSMGVPVVAFPGAFDGWGMPIRRAFSPAPGRIAVPICEILESAEIRGKLAAAARSWCDHARVRDGFRGTLIALWHEVSNTPLPALANAPAAIS